MVATHQTRLGPDPLPSAAASACASSPARHSDARLDRIKLVHGQPVHVSAATFVRVCLLPCSARNRDMEAAIKGAAYALPLSRAGTEDRRVSADVGCEEAPCLCLCVRYRPLSIKACVKHDPTGLEVLAACPSMQSASHIRSHGAPPSLTPFSSVLCPFTPCA